MRKKQIVEVIARAMLADLGYIDRLSLEQLSSADFLGMAEAAIKAVRASGYVIVPREPTEAMIVAGCRALKDVPADKFMEIELGGRHAMPRFKMDLRWRAMIEASK